MKSPGRGLGMQSPNVPRARSAEKEILQFTELLSEAA